MQFAQWSRIAHWRDADPRWFQVVFLASFLAVVVTRGGFTLSPVAMVVIGAAALLTQSTLVRILGISPPGYLSPLISALSLCLLLRAEGLVVPAVASVLSIASKFTLRVDGKHIFNPTNFGLLLTVLLSDRAWVSPGQWGSGVVAAFLFAALGLMVVRKVGRLDITVAFLVVHAGLLIVRSYYFGEPDGVVLHRLMNGALIIFAFFMISDPRSTPNTRAGRILFASLVASLGYILRFHYFMPSAPLWALLAVSPVTPLIDRVWSGVRFDWAQKGATNATNPAVVA